MREKAEDAPVYIVGAHEELWCSFCGAVIYDEEIHTDWHRAGNGRSAPQEPTENP